MRNQEVIDKLVDIAEELGQLLTRLETITEAMDQERDLEEEEA